MWSILAVFSAILLGLYDVAKKTALKKNGVLTVLLVATALSTLFLAPFFRLGPASGFLRLGLKAVLVTASWISGMIGLKMLPLTTVSTIKGSRPVFVVLFSIILFGEHLNWMQWSGIALALVALWLLGRTSRADGTVKARRTGFIWMGVSVVTGVASALYDKHIIAGLDPLFVQCWTNLFITVILALCVCVERLFSGASVSGTFRFASSLPSAMGPSRSHGHGRPCFPETEAPENSLTTELDSTATFSSSNTGEDASQDGRVKPVKFQWDWTLVVVAVLITAADMLYFFALKQPDALLSVISVIRRGSVLVTFICGAIIFKEGNLRAKGLNMLLMAAGIALLLIGS
ncbi:MAG: DMT family transporter [Bacteroidales bacterium]|nr:DMT family transporter [Bacteroidales bacterium]